MLKNILFRLFAFQIVLAKVVSAFAFNSSRCADPPGFDSCWNRADANAIATFKAHCTNGTCTGVNDCFTSDVACAKLTVCVAYTEWIGCALNHCWNRVSNPAYFPVNSLQNKVYNCEYQHLAIRAMENCPIADQLPPYVPAPAGAPGYCSCNIGFVFAEHLKMNRPDAPGELLQCTNTIASLKAAGTCEPNCDNEDRICRCCADSSATST